MKISVCIPTYHGVDYIEELLNSIKLQTYKDVEIIICNDSKDDHESMANKLEGYKDLNIKYTRNEKNLGYPGNLKKCVDLSSGEILFLMGQDDVILGNDVFENCIKVFNENPNVGVITRPYYWFDEDINTPIRFVPKHDKRIITIQDSSSDIRAVLETVGQLSGLVYKKDLITHDFQYQVFTAHIYPFLSVMKTHDCYFYPDFNIAVRTSSSQTRFLSSIYRPSPTKTWVEMFINVWGDSKFESARKIGIEHICLNYVGLVQIKNYGYFKDLLTDIYYLVKYRPQNLLSPVFWVYLISVLLIPRFFLRRMVDYYKNEVSRKNLKDLLHG